MIRARPQGTTFCLEEGIHRLRAGVLVKSYDRIIGVPGAILDGRGVATQGLFGHGGPSGQKGVVIRRIVLRNFTGDAISAGWDWRIVGNVIRGNRIGVEVNDGTVLRGNRIHHNRRYGVIGGPTRNVLIESNEIAYNNTSHSCRGSCVGDAGGSKIVGSTPGTYGVVWRANWVHHNVGPGIWSDGNVHDVLYEDNIVVGNTGPGIFHEISWDATIRDNVVRGNDTEVKGESCFWGSQIHVNNSQNVRIIGNHVRSGLGANGICLVDASRTDVAPFPARLSDVVVRHNVIHLSRSETSGLVGDAARRVTFDGNAYVVPDPTASFWAWYDRYPLTWRQFRVRGQELNGSRA